MNKFSPGETQFGLLLFYAFIGGGNVSSHAGDGASNVTEKSFNSNFTRSRGQFSVAEKSFQMSKSEIEKRSGS
jgi:hypothetical protein